MIYRVSRTEKPIAVKEFTKKKDALEYANSFKIKSGVPVPKIEKINSDGKVVGQINLYGDVIQTWSYTTDSQKKASAAYDKTHTKGIYLKLNLSTDADIIKKLEEVGNVQGYIKGLIKTDIGNLP